MRNNSMRRREFITRSANVTAGLATTATTASLWTPPVPLLTRIGATAPEPLPPIEDPRIKALVQRGLDASRSAGAVYADVRLTHTFNRRIGWLRAASDSESMTVGVRVLIDGYWGFASGPVWSLDEMARLGREATHHAKTNTLGKPRPSTLAPTPIVQDGHWATPVRIDPFSLHPSVIMDVLEGLVVYATRRQGRVQVHERDVVLNRIEKAFGSTDGSYYTQRQYLTSGLFRIEYIAPDGRKEKRIVDGLDPASVGFELFDEPTIQQRLDDLIEDIKADFALPVQPVEVGRYDVMLDAGSVANVVDSTIGIATELDRALGYEANNSGTSYLNEPFDMLGTLAIGSPVFTVTMDRTAPGGAATVRWDDEGVPTRSATLITDGILTAFQTTRESAMWLRELAPQSSAPAQSTGSSYAPSAMDAPLTRTGNLVLQPSGVDQTEDDLLRDMKKGLFFRELGLSLDFQQLNGFAMGKVYDIRNGKKVAIVSGVGMMFKATELWKRLTAIGGASSAHRSAARCEKGQPSQRAVRSITAVPGVFSQQSVIDLRRKA